MNTATEFAARIRNLSFVAAGDLIDDTFASDWTPAQPAWSTRTQHALHLSYSHDSSTVSGRSMVMQFSFDLNPLSREVSNVEFSLRRKTDSTATQNRAERTFIDDDARRLLERLRRVFREQSATDRQLAIPDTWQTGVTE